MDQTATTNGYTGILPATAPLAVPFVPFQQNNPPTYDAKKGLVRGTLFPGLELPYLGMINKEGTDVTPLQELMAMSFALTELNLYLDTHPDDTEALSLFRSYVELYQKAAATYEAQYGPITASEAGKEGMFDWVDDPWPWNLPQPRTTQTAKEG